MAVKIALTTRPAHIFLFGVPTRLLAARAAPFPALANFEIRQNRAPAKARDSSSMPKLNLIHDIEVSSGNHIGAESAVPNAGVSEGEG
jgi:hypothetical protein